MSDIFQPKTEPARSIYEAFQLEAAKRNERELDVWQSAELNAVHREAGIQAQRLGLRVPTLEDVVNAERYAMGSVDYAAKWAYRVVDAMHKAE